MLLVHFVLVVLVKISSTSNCCRGEGNNRLNSFTELWTSGCCWLSLQHWRMVGVVGAAGCPARQVSSIRPTVTTYQNYRITVITVTLDADYHQSFNAFSVWILWSGLVREGREGAGVLTKFITNHHPPSPPTWSSIFRFSHL